MKRILFLILFTMIAFRGVSQTNSIFGFYAGGGLATAHNFDVALSGGLEFQKALFNRTWLGISAFYQGYGVLYDKEANNATDGAGAAGMAILNRSAFVFLAPKLSHDLGRKGFLKANVNVGFGFNMGGTETMSKWDHSYSSPGGNFDSLITTTKNINKMAIRLGLGLTEYVSMGRHWWFTITEDMGFLTSSLSKSSDVDNPSRTIYSPNKLAPTYISLQIGVSHTKY